MVRLIEIQEEGRSDLNLRDVRNVEGDMENVE